MPGGPDPVPQPAEGQKTAEAAPPLVCHQRFDVARRLGKKTLAFLAISGVERQLRYPHFLLWPRATAMAHFRKAFRFMPNLRSFFAALVTCAALAACSSGGSSGTDPDPDPDPDSGLSQKERLEELLLLIPFGAFTPAADMPSTGSAEYTGFVALLPDGVALTSFSGEIIGDATLTVGFAPRGRHDRFCHQFSG